MINTVILIGFCISFGRGETFGLSAEEAKFYSYTQSLSFTSNNSRTPALCGKKDNGNSYWCMPDLFLIGVSKGGTSSMAMHLNNHHLITNVRGGGKNEGHFFDTKKEVAMPNVCPDIIDPYSRPIVMDFTPNYLSVDAVPRILRSLYSDDVAAKLRFVVALREPVSRAVSSWLYKKNSHPNLPGFADSVAEGIKEGKCIAACYNKHRIEIGSSNHVESFRACEIEECVDRVMSAHVVKSM